MTSAQRIAIAEAWGWKDVRPGSFGELYGVPPVSCGCDANELGRAEVPDFLHDLNAMHSALASQDESFNQRFHKAIQAKADRLHKFQHELTASDWAEEFLRTLSPWKEDAPA